MHGRPAFQSNAIKLNVIKSYLGRAIVVGVLLLVGQLHGRARAADLAREILTSDAAQNYAEVIHGYVVGRAADLQSPDPAKVRSAREELVQNLRGITAPTASFSDTYCKELAVTLLPLTSSSDPRVRLNVAIVTERVAERTQDAGFRLEQLLIPELKDANSGIVLWAMQASRFVLVPVLNVNGANSKLLPSVLDAAKKTTSGAVIGAAYTALSSDSTATTLPIYISAVTDLLNYRIQQYSNGSLPPEPPMDARATNFLSDRTVWTFKGFDKTRAVQKIVDLMNLAASNMPTAQGVDKDELALLLSNEAGAIQAIAIIEQNPVLGSAMQSLRNPSGNSRMAPAVLTQNINAALAAIITAFPAVHKTQLPAMSPPGMSSATSRSLAATTAPTR